MLRSTGFGLSLKRAFLRNSKVDLHYEPGGQELDGFRGADLTRRCGRPE